MAKNVTRRRVRRARRQARRSGIIIGTLIGAGVAYLLLRKRPPAVPPILDVELPMTNVEDAEFEEVISTRPTIAYRSNIMHKGGYL